MNKKLLLSCAIITSITATTYSTHKDIVALRLAIKASDEEAVVSAVDTIQTNQTPVSPDTKTKLASFAWDMIKADGNKHYSKPRSTGFGPGESSEIAYQVDSSPSENDSDKARSAKKIHQYICNQNFPGQKS